MIFLYALGILGGMMIPIQTSVNSKLIAYTRSIFYAATLSFIPGLVFLFFLNLLINPELISIHFFSKLQLGSLWLYGGLLGVCFLIGNLLLLPRLGASLTVVMTITGQIFMGVIIDTFGLFGASQSDFSFLKLIGITMLILGVTLMNDIRAHRLKKDKRSSISIWLILGIVFGFTPSIQIAFNSALSKQINSSIMAAFISVLVGTIALFLLTLIFNKGFKLDTNNITLGKLKPHYFGGGILGAIFVTTNILLMPHLGATVTTIVVMFGQMLMALLIDHFGLLGVNKNQIHAKKVIGLLSITMGTILLRFF